MKIIAPAEIEVKVVKVHVKVRDEGSYELQDSLGKVIASNEGYVPSFFPGEHYGDYLILDIDLETGTILNWKKPCASDVEAVFFAKE